MRVSKLKIADLELKKYLLENYVNEKGDKVSDRELWSRQEFFEYTGLYKVNEYTDTLERVSLGTVSYWKKKLGVKEREIFDYHQNVTGRIAPDIDYRTWSKLNNKGHKKTKVHTRESFKNSLISYLGLEGSLLKNYSYDKVIKVCMNFWEELGLDAKEEYKRFETKFYDD